MLIYIKEEDTGGQVFDESGDQLYRFERKTGFLPGCWIYQQQREIGALRTEFGSVSRFGVFVGREKRDIITGNPLNMKAGLKFERSLWKVTGDFSNLSLTVSDGRGRWIADVSRDVSGFTVKLNSEKDLYMVLMAWLAAGMAG